uniref:AVT protein n=1 Tax=Fopius arisanus TaxID=64838 RepID=A0A0C9RSJ2_9HYME
MWGDTIEKFIDKLVVQHVIHIEGSFPKSVSDQFNSGTTPYELVLQSNTIVTDLGKIKLPSVAELNDSVPVVPLINVAEHKKIIAVQGFVKTPWAVIKKQNNSIDNTCFGSIAADKYFLDVKISDYAPDFICEFTKGQHVQCLGSVIRNGNCYFFCVQAPSCITLVDSQVTTLKYLLLCKPLMTLQEESNTASANSSKKLKIAQKH